MRHRMIVTIIMLGLWPLLVMATSDHVAEAAWSLPRAQCDPVSLSGVPVVAEIVLGGGGAAVHRLEVRDQELRDVGPISGGTRHG